jgi:hypothetical protein
MFCSITTGRQHIFGLSQLALYNSCIIFTTLQATHTACTVHKIFVNSIHNWPRCPSLFASAIQWSSSFAGQPSSSQISFRKPETQNLHPEGICFWQTELSGGSATTLGFRIPVRSFTMSPDRCPLLDGDQWLVCLYRFPQASPTTHF